MPQELKITLSDESNARIQELKITLGDDGNLRIDGPIDDLVRAYGLLELAKDALRMRAMSKAMEQQQRKIEVPSMHLNSPFRR